MGEKMKLKYLEIITDTYRKLNALREHMEDTIDVDDGQEEDCELYDCILSNGADMLKSISVITGMPVEKVAEEL